MELTPDKQKSLDDVLAKIEELNQKAAPYRELDEDDTRKDKLSQLVNEINALRKVENQIRTGYRELNTPQPELMDVNEGMDFEGLSTNQMKRAKR